MVGEKGKERKVRGEGPGGTFDGQAQQPRLGHARSTHPNPTPPTQLYLIGVLVVFWCSSLGCFMSIVLGNNGALVASVAVLMVIGG